MERVFLIFSILILFIGAHVVVAEEVRPDNSVIFEDEFIGNLDIDLEDDIEGDFLEMPGWESRGGGKVLVNVDSFGAVGDGISDDTQVKKKIASTSLLVCCFLSRLTETFV